MKRFRFTLLAVCLVLLLLGAHDIRLLLRNPAPLTISLADLERRGAPRDWLRIRDARLDLLEAISTSGTIELEAFLVPLKTVRGQQPVRVMVETRDPAVMELLRTYYFKLDSERERQEFLAKNRDAFFPQREVTGMLVGNLIATANRDKLLGLAKQVGMDVSEDVIFISEDKTPPKWRGVFFALIGLAGLIKILWPRREPSRNTTG
ncbi:hypothetical protein EDC39_11086 [Geothermobacter ehrlichii]|uniref:Uncharacterized protein n=1 Tax=Geothermobacter ehrlichii TaxID=213224 RepID=A0A5D3WI60_9BACT|nr:hypothetical protein [Geothermobacter ehrlichii]TYO97546.1 hypothetical protein EDC39_11086 [Geothermobacter ehrlichii]